MTEQHRILLILLDGLGDLPAAELGQMTPAEAAQTPLLDRLAREGMSGLHVPFGPGRATSSEISHWSLFGYGNIPFIGRAALEGLGQGLDLPVATAMFQVALRNGRPSARGMQLGARAKPGHDDEDAAALFNALGHRHVGGFEFELLPLRTGEAVLVVHGAGLPDVSDSDSLFDEWHPWMQPQPLADARDPMAAGKLALALTQWLQEGREILRSHSVNADRQARGGPTFDTPVSKWASWIDPALPSFGNLNGISGAQVTDTALYRGFAEALQMPYTDIAYDKRQPAEDMHKRLTAARELLVDNTFVHLHVKATDEAGHQKNPALKREVIEATEQGLADIEQLIDHCVVAVTGDHATPSTGPLLHSGDPTPFTVCSPQRRPDHVEQFGERFAATGSLGRLAARDVLPLLTGLANRPFFLGHRPGPYAGAALPETPAAMPFKE